MTSIHFDVDKAMEVYLPGEVYPYGLQEIPQEKVFDAEIITIHNTSLVNEQVLSHFPHLKFIITRTVGIDHINKEVCINHGISISHIPDYGAFAIAEHALTLLLCGSRNILSVQSEIHKGIFSYKNHTGFTLHRKTLGVIGTGRIGQELIKLVQPFDMNILAYDLFPNSEAAASLHFTYTSLEEVLLQSDCISLHTPLSKETTHLINEEAIRKMKDQMILINTARGGLIDTQALIAHISKFRFIGFDVVENELEFNKDNPLLSFPHVVITPHIAFYTDETMKKIATETLKYIEEYSSGNHTGNIV
jgi:D-lactate dehydrogenase